MIAEPTGKLNGSHTGPNEEKIRILLGIEQEVSVIERKDEIEEGLLLRIAEVLGVSSEMIRDFDVESALNPYSFTSNKNK